ncbi:MAG: DUF4012 domain-containing protein, partial [Candidatus Berkelbacteria bacterium]|nr:DUF4012 domain-containing protein [Candidatus Berkelbacteria bacterium]
LPDHPLLNNQLTLGQNMLELGLLIRDTNNDLNTLLDSVTDNQSQGENLLQKVNNLKPIITRIEDRVNRADIILKANQDVKKNLGAVTYSKIADIIDKSKIELDKIEKVIDVFPLILGTNGDNNYLILFLNNAEMRPGGGFPGNYGIISFQDNQYKGINIDNIYNLDRLERSEIDKIWKDAANGTDPRIEAGLPTNLYLPKPVDEVTDRKSWLMFSSNWNLDFRNNAQREIYLYKNFYHQDDVNGVIAFTPNTVEEILGIVGPIKMDDYGVEINKDNFRPVMEFKIELDNPYKREQRYDINPKQILSDFGPKLMDKISKADLGQKIKIFEAVLNGTKKKEILFYHNDPKVESVISEFAAAGEIKNPDGDFLGIVQSNINAMKNGRIIDTRASLKSEVNSLGFAMDELSLTIINNESSPGYMHGREESYYEILVPLGSRVREAKLEGKDFIGEIDYFEEAGHTILGFRIGLDPGEAKNVMIKYQAPISGYTDHGYSLDVFKQAGAKPIEFSGEINFEKNSQNLNNPLIFKRAIDSDFIIKN